MASQGTVSVSTGVVDALIRKLESLSHQSPRKLKAIEKKEVNSLKGELSSMSVVLRKSAMMKAPDVQVMEWMRQVREVTFDAEDYVDRFLMLQDQPPPAPAAVAGRRQRSLLFSAVTLVGRSRSPSPTPGLSFVEQLRRFKERLSEANERRERYRVSVDPVQTSDTSGAVEDLEPTLDPHLVSMQHADPVGTDGPTRELVGMLTAGEDHAKVVSIVGVTGIGKTTLANQVYLALQQDGFQCRAFVYIGRRNSVKSVLTSIIRQIISRQQNHDDDIETEYDAITKLRALLDEKRYLIVIDDVLSISAWKAISCALPQNYLKSRIILTTRFYDVARSCSSHPFDATYEIKTLGHKDSVRLFHRRVFGSDIEEEDCPDQFCKACHLRILKVCGGLPLSILLVASFLARTTAKPEDWETIYKSTLSSMEHHLLLEGPRKMIHLSYDSLPFPIKSCFLYLSIFPKNYMVNKDRLIWRWIAEGFISGRGENAWRTGRSYFNELANRSLTKPQFVDDEDDPVCCTVHAAIHDFIVSLSSEENFVTLDEELESMPRDVIRRLSLNYSKQENIYTVPMESGGIINLSQVRSLTAFGPAHQRMPHLMNFLLLRVLDLEGAERLESNSLEYLGRLFNLKYLGLGGKGVTELPESIGELQHLETLDMRQTSLQKLPAAAGRLQKLVRLLAQVLDGIPRGVEKMQDLEVLSMVAVNSLDSLNFIAKLDNLKQLRILGVKWCLKDDITDDDGAILVRRSDFVSYLNKITKSDINSLTIHSDEACALDFLEESWVPPSHLRKLVLKASSTSTGFPPIPKNLAKCVHLSYLEIGINLDRDQDQDLLLISELPALTILKLSARGKSIVIKQGFECLKVFFFQRREGGLGLVFETGAMPLLRKLRLYFKVAQEEKQQGSLCGLRHLSSLQRVHATIDCRGAQATKVVLVEAAIKEEIRENDTRITYELNRDNEEYMVQDGVQTRAETRGSGQLGPGPPNVVYIGGMSMQIK